jgi:hypothetical protein
METAETKGRLMMMAPLLWPESITRRPRASQFARRPSRNSWERCPRAHARSVWELPHYPFGDNVLDRTSPMPLCGEAMTPKPGSGHSAAFAAGSPLAPGADIRIGDRSWRTGAADGVLKP